MDISANGAEVAHSLSNLLDTFLSACSVPDQSPRVAVAVSGGADSMALALLVHRWAEKRGGRCFSLTVDHRLRSTSSEEAQRVALWMRDRGIKHEILMSEAPPPDGVGQAWARRCRYALLQEWCRCAGIMHLLLAHHAQDQEETLLIRHLSGSGRLGLSGMSPVSTRPYVRILRPFLDVPPENFRLFLRSEKQSWIEDPSNKNPRYARGRLRIGNVTHAYSDALIRSEKPTVQQFPLQERFALEELVDHLLARAVLVSEVGFASIDIDCLRRASLDVSVYCMRRVLACIGGLEYLPSEKKTQTILESLLSCPFRKGYSVGRCLVRRCGRDVLVVREERAMLSKNIDFVQDGLLWDGRFLVTNTRKELGAFVVSSLGKRGIRFLQSLGMFSRRLSLVPKLVWPTVPALWRDGVLAYVPHVGYACAGVSLENAPVIRFAPHHSLGTCTFRLAARAFGPTS